MKPKKKKRSIDSPKEAKSQVKKGTLLISIALVIILGFAVYGNSFKGQFIWDDTFLISDNAYIKDWSNISKFFTESMGSGAGVPERYTSYRPLQMLTYVFDYSLWGLNVRGYHLSNILFHILAGLAVFWLIGLLYQDWLLALLTSIFFVVHPIHTEAVTYISGRADSLATIFILLCFIFYIKGLHTKSKTFYLLMPLVYIFALLSRENSLILPLLLVLYHYSFKERLNIKLFFPIATMAFIYILLRLTALKSLLASVSCPTTLLQRIPAFFVAITDYLRLLLLPFNLHMEYGNKVFNLTHPQALLGMLILFSLLIYASRKRKTNSLVFFSILWFFIALLACSNLYPLNAYMAEHWLYLPSIGFFLILAQIFKSLFRVRHLKTLSVISIISLLAFYCYLTVRQNIYWREPLTFYERSLRYTPDSPRMLNNLGLIYSAIGSKVEAIALYKKAIEIKPTDIYAYSNLGLAYFNLGRKEESVTAYKKVIEIKPNHARAYNNLAATYFDLGRKEEAIALIKKAIQLNPDYAGAYNNLGLAYFDIGRKEEAVAAYKKAIEINPYYARAYSNLALAYFKQSQYSLAIKYYDQAEKLGSGDRALSEALKPYR